MHCLQGKSVKNINWHFSGTLDEKWHGANWIFIWLLGVMPHFSSSIPLKSVYYSQLYTPTRKLMTCASLEITEIGWGKRQFRSNINFINFPLYTQRWNPIWIWCLEVFTHENSDDLVVFRDYGFSTRFWGAVHPRDFFKLYIQTCWLLTSGLIS